MKSIALCSAVFIALAPCALADQTSKIAKIEEMFQLLNMDRMQKQVFEQMKSAALAQTSSLSPESSARAKEMQDKIFALVAERMSWDKMKPAYIKLYDETFTEEELTGIVDFYKSPGGRAMVDKMPQLMSKSMALAQSQMGDTTAEIQRIVSEGKQKPKPAAAH
jgi:hypothetical protein